MKNNIHPFAILILLFGLINLQSNNAQTYTKHCTIQGNIDSDHGNAWYEGTSTGDWTGTGTISYSSWGSVGRGSNSGYGIWTCTFPVSKIAGITSIQFNFLGVFKESNVWSTEVATAYVRNYSTWNWDEIQLIVGETNTEFTQYLWVDAANYINSNGDVSFILDSDDELVIDYVEFWYSCPTPSQPGSITGLTSVCAGDARTYSISSVSGATSYAWSYSGGGTPSGTGTSCTLSPTSSGTLSVTANNACGQSSARTLDIIVSSVPSQPGTISGSSSSCVGTSTTYSVSNVSGATSYTWTLPSGWSGLSTTNSIIVTNVGSNSGSVCVTANNSCGSSTSRCKSVNPSETPSQPGSITGNTSPCVGSSQTYSVSTVSGATSYGWTLPTGWSGSSTSNSITVTVGSNSGSIGVRAENSCGNSSYSYLSVNHVTVPSQPGSITGETSPCAGSSQTYSIIQVSGATSYTWTLPSGWSGSSTTNTITVTVGGNSGNICITANNGSCASSERCLSVSPLNKPDQPGTISGEVTMCEGSNQTYSIVAVSGATSYTWSYSGGGFPSGTGTSCNLTPTSSGILSVTANNNCGASTVRTIALVVISKPSQPGTLSGETYPCVGSPQVYSIDIVSGATSYTWSVPADWSGSDTTNSISAVVGITGGDICVTANNVCGNSPSKCILVGPVDSVSQPGAISGETNPCTNSEQIYSVIAVQGATSYEWTLQNGWSGTSNSNSITVSVGENEGDICVRAINSCNTSEYSCLPVTIGGIAPEQPGLISGEGSPCVGSSVTYKIAPVDSSDSYTWSLPAGWTGTSTADSIVVVAGNNSGTICVTANNECGNSLQRCFTVTPVSIPVQPGSITGEPTPCTGTQQNYSIIEISGADYYSWELPENWTGSSITTSIKVTVTDNSGEICVVAENKCGTSPEKCLLITPAKAPDQPSEIIGYVNPCWDSIIIYSVTVDANAAYYEWEFPEDWTGSSTTNSINTTMGHDTGNVCVMAVNQCGSSVGRCFVVQPKFCPCIPPEAPSGVTATDGMVINEITITWEPVNGANSYIIFRNGDSIVTRPASQNYYTDYSAPCKVITYEVYASNDRCKSENSGSDTGYRMDCGDQSSLTILSSLDFNIYPNPAKDYLNISFCCKSPKFSTIHIYNPLGQEILSFPVNGEKTQSIDISQLKPGLYFLCNLNNNQKTLRKFVVVR